MTPAEKFKQYGSLVCSFEGCLQDAWYAGRCRAHGGVPPCKNCGHPQDEHYVVNFADGQMISGDVKICPTAIYEPAR